MLAAMDAEDLAEWEVLYELDPWGPERADLANGLLCSLTDACHRAHGHAMAPIDYMPHVKNLQKAMRATGQSNEEMQAIWLEACAAFNKEPE